MFPIRARQRPIPSITASDLPYFQFYDLPHRTHTQYKRSLSMPSERTVTIRSHTPQTATMKRFNKKTTKNRKTRLPHHIQPPPQKKRATCTSQLPLRRLKSMSMLPPPNSLPQLPVPNIALFGKYHLQFHKSMASRMPRNA